MIRKIDNFRRSRKYVLILQSWRLLCRCKIVTLNYRKKKEHRVSRSVYEVSIVFCVISDTEGHRCWFRILKLLNWIVSNKERISLKSIQTVEGSRQEILYWSNQVVRRRFNTETIPLYSEGISGVLLSSLTSETPPKITESSFHCTTLRCPF